MLLEEMEAILILLMIQIAQEKKIPINHQKKTQIKPKMQGIVHLLTH